MSFPWKLFIFIMLFFIGRYVVSKNLKVFALFFVFALLASAEPLRYFEAGIETNTGTGEYWRDSETEPKPVCRTMLFNWREQDINAWQQ